jgi:hypothetical protein
MEALGVMVEVIFYLVVDGVLESRSGLLPSASPGLWHRWRGVHAVSLPLHPGTDHRARCQVPVLAKRMSPGRSYDMINMSV